MDEKKQQRPDDNIHSGHRRRLRETYTERGCESMHDHQLLELLKTLSGRERMILSMRFGLLGQRVHTLREISNHFNISRERVRQLEMQTLNKLRTPENLRLLGAHRP